MIFTSSSPEERCPRCGTALCETGHGPRVCPRCELAAALGEGGAAALPFSGVFGDYDLEGIIAHGGMGAVYRARRRDSGRAVAIKTLLAGRLASNESRERFLREARLAAKLRHPNIVSLLEVGETEGLPFIAMELVAGKNLADTVRDGPLSPRHAAGLVAKVALAVAHAHELGVLHRDLKPANILLDENGEPRVADFGVARSMELVTELTLTGQVLGSPGYLAPERVPQDLGTKDQNGDGASATSDVYSLGATFYHLLTGRPPFQGATLEAVLMQVVKNEPISPRKLNPSVPLALEAICLKCLEKEPHRRYASATELAEDLQHFLDGQPVRARLPGVMARGWRWGQRNRSLAVALVVVLVLLLILAIGSPIAAWRINRERLHAELSAANETRHRARAEKLSVERRARLYATRINLAQQIFAEGDVSRVLELLNSLRPQSGEEDLRGFEWRYLWQLCHSEDLVFSGHKGFVRAVVFSPDGRTVASAGDDTVVRLWDSVTGENRGQLRGHTNAITGLAFTPAGDRLASVSADQTARLWDVARDGAARVLWADSNLLSCVAVSKDGRMLAAGTARLALGAGGLNNRFLPVALKLDHHITLWDLETMRMTHVIPTNIYGTLSLAFSPDGKSLAAGGRSKRINLLDPATGLVRVALTNTIPVSCFGLAFSPDGQQLATASWNPTYANAEVKLLNARSGEGQPVHFQNPGPVTCLASSPDGKSLATGGVDYLVRLWEINTGRMLAQFAGHTNTVWALAWSPDGHRVASAGWDGTVRVWKTAHQQDAERMPSAANFSLAFSPDGALLAAGGKGIELWNARSGEWIGSVAGARTNDTKVAFAPDGQTLAACGADGVIQLFATNGWKLAGEIPSGRTEKYSFIFSPDGRRLAISARDGTARIFEPASLRESLRLTNVADRKFYLAFTPDGRRLITSGPTIQFWDSTTGKMLASHPGPATSLAVSPDGKKLAAGTSKGVIGLFDLETMTREQMLEGHKDEISTLVFSPDGRTLASGGWDGGVKLWQVAGGDALLSFKSKYGLIWTVAFSPDARMLAFGGGGQNSRGGEITLLRATPDENTDSKR